MWTPPSVGLAPKSGVILMLTHKYDDQFISVVRPVAAGTIGIGLRVDSSLGLGQAGAGLDLRGKEVLGLARSHSHLDPLLL